MKRQLTVMVVATTSLVLIALLVPMGWLIERFAEEDALASGGFELERVETFVDALADRRAIAANLAAFNSSRNGTRASVIFADGLAIGPDPQLTPPVRNARIRGQSVVLDTAAGVEFLAAVYGRPEGPAVVRLVVLESRLDQGVYRSWLVIAGLGVALLVLAVFVANRLGRAFVGPLAELVGTASRLGQGDLDARVTPAGPPDISALGRAFNQLAERVAELLSAQREEVANLAHRLRTPLTASRLDAENLSEPAERARMTAHVDALAAMVHDLIAEARRPVREGALAACDAVAVVADRTRFWSVLAEDQQRCMRRDLADGPIPVRASREDLAAAVDALLGNVFDHTEEGTDFAVAVRPRKGGGCELVVVDDGPGLPGPDVLRRGSSGNGSTGLGLDIVRRTADAARGRLRLASRPSGGTEAVVELGPPAG